MSELRVIHYEIRYDDGVTTCLDGDLAEEQVRRINSAFTIAWAHGMGPECSPALKAAFDAQAKKEPKP